MLKLFMSGMVLACGIALAPVTTWAETLRPCSSGFTKGDDFLNSNLVYQAAAVKTGAPYMRDDELLRDDSEFAVTGLHGCLGLDRQSCLVRMTAVGRQSFISWVETGEVAFYDGDFACVFLSDMRNPWWIRRSDLITVQQSLTRDDWFGTWTYGETSITIMTKRDFIALYDAHKLRAEDAPQLKSLRDRVSEIPEDSLIVHSIMDESDRWDSALVEVDAAVALPQGNSVVIFQGGDKMNHGVVLANVGGQILAADPNNTAMAGPTGTLRRRPPAVRR